MRLDDRTELKEGRGTKSGSSLEANDFLTYWLRYLPSVYVKVFRVNERRLCVLAELSIVYLRVFCPESTAALARKSLVST